MDQDEGRHETLGRRHGSERSDRFRHEDNAHADRQPHPMAVKLYRTKDLVTVAAPMPGLGPGDVAVVVSPDRKLTIVGRLCADPEADCGMVKLPEKEVLLDEWDVGPYRRELELPTDVDGESATLTYGNGILVVALPVATHTRPARLTLEHVNTHPRGGRVGRPNRQIGGGTHTQSDGQALERGAALLAGGVAALCLLRRGATAGGLLAVAAGTVAPTLIARARMRRAARAERASAQSITSPSSSSVEEASEESFPASDPPSWTGTRARVFD